MRIHPGLLRASIVTSTVLLFSSTAPAQREKPDLADCTLYVTGASRDVGSKVTFSGSIGNPGPGTARNVSVEVALVDESGESIYDAKSNVRPTSIGPGAQGSFEITVPESHWKRARADSSYAGPRVSIESGRCLTAEAGDTDDAGLTRADYMDAAMDLLESRAVLRYEKRLEKTKRARLQMAGAGHRKRRSGGKLIADQRASIEAIDRFLTTELPERMGEANSPDEWIRALPQPPTD